jgi:hypothetical protein
MVQTVLIKQVKVCVPYGAGISGKGVSLIGDGKWWRQSCNRLGFLFHRTRLSPRLQPQERPLDHVKQATESSRANTWDLKDLGSCHLHQQFRYRPAKQSLWEMLVVVRNKEPKRSMRKLLAHESAQTLAGPIKSQPVEGQRVFGMSRQVLLDGHREKKPT